MKRRRFRRPPGRGIPPGRHPFRAAAEAEAAHLRLIRIRAAWLLVLLAVAMLGLAYRLVSLHVVRAAALEKIAERQQLGTLPLEPQRGRLLDREGRPLAINVDAESAFAVPSKIDDPQAFARTVAPVIGMRVDELAGRLRPDRHFLWLARKITPQAAAALRAKGLGEQIGFLTEPRRNYPNGTLAASVLGFSGIDNQGLAGAELAFERYLKGASGLAQIERDAMGRPRFETRTVLREPTDGADVVLTIDQVLQYIAERELDQALTKTRATWGTILVMDPQTGEMLAMATAPRFDPNAYERARPAEWKNPAIVHAYEPGSTFKVVLAAAALESRAVDPQEVFVNNGYLRVGGYTIREAQGHKYPRETLAGIVRVSSNVGAAMVATRLGPSRYSEIIRRLGFGAPTGIELPGEAAGLVPPTDRWTGATLQTMAFGQGISVTPLQLLMAGAALATDGMLIPPHVLRAVRDPEGRALVVTAPERGRRVLSIQVAKDVMAMLEDAVERGTGTQAKIDGYRLAGKTGTAQKPAPTGGYLSGAYVASFLGIVPADQPRLVILVVLDNPRGQYYGGVVAAPVFRAVAAQALWRLHIAPSTAPVLTGQPR